MDKSMYISLNNRCYIVLFYFITFFVILTRILDHHLNFSPNGYHLYLSHSFPVYFGIMRYEINENNNEYLRIIIIFTCFDQKKCMNKTPRPIGLWLVFYRKTMFILYLVNTERISSVLSLN